MDFISDIENIARKTLEYFDIDICNINNPREFVSMFVQLHMRLIQPIPIKVIKSQKIINSTYNKTIENVLTEIESKFISGEDILPYLSKTVLKFGFTDHLFADWRINHLHLNPKIEGQKFVERSKLVLFIIIFKDIVYFIDIRPHGKNGEKHVFAQKELLQILYDEWPFILEPYKTMITDMAFNVDQPKHIEGFRKSGWTIPQKIGEYVYMPMGGGITTAGTSTEVSIETDRLYKLVYCAEDFMKNNMNSINKKLSKLSGYDSSSFKYRFSLHPKGGLILEEKTKTIIRIIN